MGLGAKADDNDLAPRGMRAGVVVGEGWKWGG